MKIGKAITAMQRGEVVRRRGQSGGFRISDGTLEHQSTDKAWIRSGPYFFDNNLKYDDWVIVRKKKKARRFSEDELEPVGTMPMVGDVVFEPAGAKFFEGRERETLESSGPGKLYCFRTKSGRLFQKDDPVFAECGNPLGTKFRILKRPAKALRDVFADPRVGDVFGDEDRHWRVIGVGNEEVAYQCIKAYGNPNGALYIEDAKAFETTSRRFTVISRAPEEVAPS